MLEIWDSLYVEARTMATVVRGHVDLHAAAEAHVPILEAFESGTPDLCTKLVIEHQHEYSTRNSPCLLPGKDRQPFQTIIDNHL